MIALALSAVLAAGPMVELSPFAVKRQADGSLEYAYDLTAVKLPDYTPECYAKAAEGSVACDYPQDVLFKIFWPSLKEKAPDAYALLKNMNYTTKDQIGMITAVDVDKKTPADAARAWVDANEKVWSAWLSK